jgi:hypothetical protein
MGGASVQLSTERCGQSTFLDGIPAVGRNRGRRFDYSGDSYLAEMQRIGAESMQSFRQSALEIGLRKLLNLDAHLLTAGSFESQSLCLIVTPVSAVVVEKAHCQAARLRRKERMAQESVLALSPQSSRRRGKSGTPLVAPSPLPSLSYP